MLMRKTSAPASKRLPIVALSEEAGPSVARILTLRDRLIGRRFPVSPGSVNCTVQLFCSPVSTSKKPVRSKPRATQSSMPWIVNILSRVHIAALPPQAPPWS